MNPPPLRGSLVASLLGAGYRQTVRLVNRLSPKAKMPSDEEARFAAIEKWGDTVGERLLRVLSPIYKDSPHRPEPVGTAILVRAQDLIFLVTAAHVITDVGLGPRYFGAAQQLFPLPAFSFKTQPEVGTDHDEFDIGYWVLDPLQAKNLSSADTVHLSDLDLARPGGFTQHAQYYLNGYPATRQPRRITEDGFAAKPLSFITDEVDVDEYAESKRSREHHLLVDFDKDDFFAGTKKLIGPDLFGVSGGAIWRLSGSPDVAPSRPKLAAVATSWRREHPRCVAGTRIRAWVEHAATQFPDNFKQVLGESRSGTA